MNVARPRFARSSRATLADWRSLRLDDLQFWHRSEARLAARRLLALALVLLLVARSADQRAGRAATGSCVPAMLDVDAAVASSRSLVHVPLVLFLARPAVLLRSRWPIRSRALVSREVSFPGRRICLMIDASTSMRTPFTAATLNKRAATDATFFTTVAAAERFVQLRMKGQYRDLIALVEFGNEAYVVTPFTNDYDNILLSISLIGDPVEFSLFPDQGTIIAQAIDESVGAVQGVRLPRRVGQPDGDLQRRRGHARHDRRPEPRRHRAGADRREDSRVLRADELRPRARARSFPTSCGFRPSRRPAASSTRPATRRAC